MNYITVQEAAVKWGISERLVRRYCAEDRIDGLLQIDGVWQIPKKAEKPRHKKTEPTQIPKLLRTLIKQRDGRQYRGLYEYLQINMVYSNGRMASNRLTRNQVELLYKADCIYTESEPIKINDIIEARNHFLCVDMILNDATKPLTQSFITQLLALLLSESCRHKRHSPISSSFRKSDTSSKFGKTTPPSEIPSALTKLFKEYEAQTDIGFHEILDLHVQFERIRPFEDCNGRIGRLLMLKECLRHGVTPFIIDDKRRTGYLNGIRQWDDDRSILLDVCMEAQMRFEAQIALQGLLECHARQMKAYNRGEHK